VVCLTCFQITDEFTFITELSYHLSTRYQRPINSIVVTLHHGACMLFGGTFDPAYVMSVFALPSQLQPTTNKRNAALIQKHMEEAIGVIPSRGFLRFIPTLEEHTAWNGKTLAGEIDDLEKDSGISATEEMVGAGVNGRRTKPKKRLSVRVSYLGVLGRRLDVRLVADDDQAGVWDHEIGAGRIDPGTDTTGECSQLGDKPNHVDADPGRGPAACPREDRKAQ
jgi:hypothetical protein